MGCIGALFRIPFGAILGYLVMMAGVFAAFTAVMVLAGTDFCFEGDSWVASEKFCVVGLGVFGVAALLGGFTAVRIGGAAAVLLLCLFVGALGSLTALGVRGQDREDQLLLPQAGGALDPAIGCLVVAVWEGAFIVRRLRPHPDRRQCPRLEASDGVSPPIPLSEGQGEGADLWGVVRHAVHQLNPCPRRPWRSSGDR